MGFATFEKLYEEFPDYPFIVLTGMQDSSLGIRAVKKGAQDFLNKIYVCLSSYVLEARNLFVVGVLLRVIRDEFDARRVPANKYSTSDVIHASACKVLYMYIYMYYA